MAELSKAHREFIVKKLAAFYTPRDIAAQLSAQFGLKCNENDVLANDPRVSVVDPDLFMLFRKEREAILDDPDAAPYADQKARLISLSRQAERYEGNNQPAEARHVYRQIAEELGVIGAKGAAAGKAAASSDAPAEIIAITRKIVHPTKVDESAA